MKIKEYTLPILILLGLGLVVLNERGTFRNITSKKYNYDKLSIKPHENLDDWKNGKFIYESADIIIKDINKTKMKSIDNLIRSSLDSFNYFESMNAGRPQSKSFDEAYALFLKKSVNQIIYTGKIYGLRTMIMFEQQPSENAIGENEFSPKLNLGISMMMGVWPGEFLNGIDEKIQNEKIKNVFEYAIILANMGQSRGVYYQNKSYENLRRSEALKIRSIPEEILKNELR